MGIVLGQVGRLLRAIVLPFVKKGSSQVDLRSHPALPTSDNNVKSLVKGGHGPV